MLCLYNGEYEEHSEYELLTPSMKTNLSVMEENYARWRGVVVGDFTCLKVEYDWGRRDQRWTVKCNLCGEVSYRYHTADWRRGKGASHRCHCHRRREREDTKEKIKTTKISAWKIECDKRKEQYAGKVFFGWKIDGDYDGKISTTVTCVDCGKQRKKVRVTDLEEGKVLSCNHKKPIDYSGDEWIGKREGHLTVTGRDGMMFIATCDCGEVIRVRPTDMFTSKRKRTCASPSCPYCNQYEREVRERHKRGFVYERDMFAELKDKGYDVEKTQERGDYGVDMIVRNDDGSKIAVQTKLWNHPVGIEAMQEVYAGGRFYDCEKFAVISYSGFSPQAVTMARKLGIYCCEGEFDYPDDIQQYCGDLLPTVCFKQAAGKRKEYEIDGERHTLAEWCALYGKCESTARYFLKKNVPLEFFLKNECATRQGRERKTYTAFGKTGTLSEICREYDVVLETVRYRMHKRHMSLEEALLAEPLVKGRPKKHPADRQITQSANTESPE